jgi:hypothetical protein
MRTIFIASLFFFVVSAVLAFFFDRISEFPIGNSQTLQTFKTPVIILAVIMGLALLITAVSLSGKKHERAQRQFALVQGWGYTVSSDDPERVMEKIKAKLEKVSPEKEFDVRTVMTVRQGNENLFLVDCWYRERDSGRGRSLGSASLIESARFRRSGAQVTLVARGVLDAALLPHQVNLGSPEFARSFIVQSREPETARRVVDESVQAILLEQKHIPSPDLGNLEIILGPGGAVILRWAQALPEDWLALADMARRLESAMN